MRTSYFGRINSNAYKKFADKCICISRTSKFWSGPSYPPLFPTWEMIKCEDEEKFEKMYTEQILSKLDPMDVWADLGDDAILICYESQAKIDTGETFCHRHIVARWLEEGLKEYGINVEIKELGPGDLDEQSKKLIGLKLARKSKAKIEKQIPGQISLF